MQGNGGSSQGKKLSVVNGHSTAESGFVDSRTIAMATGGFIRLANMMGESSASLKGC